MMQAALPSHFRLRMVSGFSRMVWKRPGEIYYIGGADVLPAPLTPEEEQDVIQQLSKDNNGRSDLHRYDWADQGDQYV